MIKLTDAKWFRLICSSVGTVGFLKVDDSARMFGQAMLGEAMAEQMAEQMAVQTAIRPAEWSAALLPALRGSAVSYPSRGRRRSYDDEAAVRRQNAAGRRSAAGRRYATGRRQKYLVDDNAVGRRCFFNILFN